MLTSPTDSLPVPRLWLVRIFILQLIVAIVLAASLLVNLFVLKQSWSLKSRIYRLESVVFSQSDATNSVPVAANTGGGGREAEGNNIYKSPVLGGF
jgi:hypothetical protein